MKTNKKIIALLAGLFILSSSYAVSQDQNELIGKWKLSDFKCEGKQVSKEFEADTQEYLSKHPATRHFQENSLIDSGPSFPQTSCYLEVRYSNYTLSNDNGKKTLSRTFNKPITVNCDNKEDEPKLKKRMEAQFNYYKENNLLTIDNEFYIEGKEMFIFQPLTKGLTDFDCGQNNRVIEVWQKIEE